MTWDELLARLRRGDLYGDAIAADADLGVSPAEFISVLDPPEWRELVAASQAGARVRLDAQVPR